MESEIMLSDQKNLSLRQELSGLKKQVEDTIFGRQEDASLIGLLNQFRPFSTHYIQADLIKANQFLTAIGRRKKWPSTSFHLNRYAPNRSMQLSTEDSVSLQTMQYLLMDILNLSASWPTLVQKKSQLGLLVQDINSMLQKDLFDKPAETLRTKRWHTKLEAIIDLARLHNQVDVVFSIYMCNNHTLSRHSCSNLLSLAATTEFQTRQGLCIQKFMGEFMCSFARDLVQHCQCLIANHLSQSSPVSQMALWMNASQHLASLVICQQNLEMMATYRKAFFSGQHVQKHLIDLEQYLFSSLQNGQIDSSKLLERIQKISVTT